MGAVVAALFLISAQVEVEATATSESRAGQAPIVAGTESRAFVAQVLRPVVELHLRERGVTLRLAYGPRIFWETPRPIDASGPLVLHTAILRLEARASRTVIFTATAEGSLGQPDYTALPQLLGMTQGALPRIARVASGT